MRLFLANGENGENLHHYFYIYIFSTNFSICQNIVAFESSSFPPFDMDRSRRSKSKCAVLSLRPMPEGINDSMISPLFSSRRTERRRKDWRVKTLKILRTYVSCARYANRTPLMLINCIYIFPGNNNHQHHTKHSKRVRWNRTNDMR